ncbi:RNA polymerase recycling motor HelD [Secundilactobacillus malefermentans]|uniref:UvrD-like helicase ATP-binding domain-containing protein n=1 Tax=Secundilactobacillus malefermentans TaxID=176292 RepID=A0A4R5NDF9_9LACO|nr:RNA polymerase recycling motor HelD [Secundilactobacillus malefermentans]KRM59017.1 superfamily I DNA RNA helicase [Secundilactobacillus malefermentans DSM 5705 = KCTC 3548]QEA31103.1 AAA family ATPase [Secundilactobacillus malefermentans]TDG71448.1 hypothetical protein C5L31_002235 [Secundilactobacillus malefermentans]
MPGSIKEQEQQHLDGVVSKIKDAQVEAKRRINTAESDETGIRNNFQNDLRIKTDSYTGMMETAISVRQQQQMLAERQNSWQHATSQLATLKRLQKTPYFARIDFHELGEPKSETIYIGLASFSDKPDHFLVYDWRAPISSVYYDGGIGEVTYQTPDGEQAVDVKLKRQFQIEDSKIKTVFDTEEAVGDQMLLDALSEQSDTKMKSIVTTIQKEQNQIIRDTKSDLLFVQGSAGSGKTAAVLQRVAYLLYRYRGHLTAGQVILFSPNQLFNDYIDQVLPELGEHNMVQMTYYQFLGRRVPNMKVETLTERFAENESTSQKRINDVINSLAFFKAVTTYSNHLGKEDMIFRNIPFRGKNFISAEQISEIYYSFNENYRLSNRLQGTKERLIKQLNRRITSEMKTKWVEQAVQDLSQEQINDMYAGEAKESDSDDKEFKFLARKIVVKEFQSVRNAIMKNRFLSINSQFVHFLRSVPQIINLEKYGISREDWQEKIKQSIDHIKDRHVRLSDISTYLYLYDLMTGKKGERAMRYVFIDEIQDYTPFQLAYLKFSFPKARFTLLGDLNQAIFTKENSKTLLEELSTMFDKDKTRVIQLTKSYRSTQQITDFTKHILTNGEAVDSFAREGALPTVSVQPSMDQALDRLEAQLAFNDSERETTAIIGKNLEDCRALADQLNGRGVKATLIQSENQRLAPGTIIVPSYLAKGLEFDAVVVWEASKVTYHDDDERQLMYTICSRAMHQLSVIAIGELSPLFDQVPEKDYEIVK